MVFRVLGDVALPAPVYDLVQRLAGNRAIETRLEAAMRGVPPAARVIDIGGGTGWAGLARGPRRYVCVDLDGARLRRFLTLSPGGMAVAGDATRCPIATASADAAVCIKTAHHLDDHQLCAMLAETVRIVVPGGLVLLIDAVQSSRLMSRLLWTLDRGAHPRPATALEMAIPPSCSVVLVDRFRASIFHDFLLIAARRVE